MYKSISIYGAFNERTGYGVHTSRLADALEKIIPVYRNQAGGEVSISIIDSVSVQNVNERLTYPSIILNVWESTSQPSWFHDKLKYFDQLWVPSEWQKACSIADGIPEEFIRVVPEGVDPERYHPVTIIDPPIPATFDFLHVGQWQPRKSTREIVEAFLKAFPGNDKVRLYLSTDTLFPSDEYKSTEERLKAYGLLDSRIVPIHFEAPEEYLRRLQSAHVFVTCARSEGWNLPLIEAIACGIPSICSDFGGSTEYAGDALLVRIRELIKPFGIYGNWQVPGMWGSPDYDHLVEVMQDSYQNYAVHKEKALRTSDQIRTKFSWAAAAKKAYDIIQEIPNVDHETIEGPLEQGFEIAEMKTRSAIFVVDCWPSSQAKMDTLSETIAQIHSLGYPVLVSSHYPLPAPITELADFYLYEKQDIMSGDDKAIYWRKKLDGTVEQKMCNREYQGVAALNCLRNAVDFCRGKYDWIYQMSADMEVDLPDWLAKVHAATKPIVCIPYEGTKNGIGGGLIAGTTEMMDTVVYPYLSSWKQYAEMFPDVRFVAEQWLFNYVASKCDPEKSIEWITCETRNRFDNVDRDIWKDEEFQYNFIGGPFLNIVGMSNREYDVTFSNPQDGAVYTLRQKTGVWSRPDKKFYRGWTITASLDGEEKFRHHLDLKGKNVLISMGSKALGDTIAWTPYVEEFRKKHGCTVYCASWWSKIFDYPEIRFVKPGDAVEDVYASYEVGCFDNQPDKNPANWRTIPLQKVAADILGVEYEPIRAKLKLPTPLEKKTRYVCFSEFSTMQNKFWNRPGAWQTVINSLTGEGYDCVSVSSEKSQLIGIISHNGQPIEQTIADISGAEFYVGLNHGPAWIAYALGIPVIMITGVSEPIVDMPTPYRVTVDVCRPGCFSDPAIPIERSWDWCPRKKDYACTREIAPEMVIEGINRIRKEKGDASDEQKAATDDGNCGTQP